MSLISLYVFTQSINFSLELANLASQNTFRTKNQFTMQGFLFHISFQKLELGPHVVMIQRAGPFIM